MSPVQLQCIDLLVLGHSLENAARKLNISSRTIRRWKKEAEFATELREAIGDLREQIGCLTLATARQSAQYASAAFTAMLPLLEDKDPLVVMRAANVVTTMSLKMTKLMTVLENHEQKQAAAEAKLAAVSAPKANEPESGQKRTSPEEKEETDEVEATEPAEITATTGEKTGQTRTSADTAVLGPRAIGSQPRPQATIAS